MMPKKLDRFDNLADQCVKDFSDSYMELEHVDGVELSVRIAKLLRNEHAWMRRQIEQIDRTRLRKDPDTPPNIQIGIAAALDDLERRLTQRRK